VYPLVYQIAVQLHHHQVFHSADYAIGRELGKIQVRVKSTSTFALARGPISSKASKPIPGAPRLPAFLVHSLHWFHSLPQTAFQLSGMAHSVGHLLFISEVPAAPPPDNSFIPVKSKDLSVS
jgi:hypothetical protein